MERERAAGCWGHKSGIKRFPAKVGGVKKTRQIAYMEVVVVVYDVTILEHGLLKKLGPR